MQEAANMILSVLPVLEDMVPPTKETAHLLGLFRAMLEDRQALEDEAYFLEHGHPREEDPLATLFATMDGPVPPGEGFMSDALTPDTPSYLDKPDLLDRDDLIAYTEQA